MTVSTAPLKEFTVSRDYQADHASPTRWVLSHVSRHGWIIFMLIIGAIGNAALAALVPILTGDAFNAMFADHPDTTVLLPLALILGGSQVIRGVLQFGRNFGAELLAQRMERDIRDELYISLLGKSMTFHNLQPVGDTMARATNDVREVNLMFNPGINLVVGSMLFLLMPPIGAQRYHWSLSIVPAVFIVFYFITLARYLKTLEPISDQIRETFGVMNTHLSESLDGVETMKGASQEKAAVEKFIINAKNVRDWFVKQGDIEGRFISMLLLGIAFAVGLAQALLLFRAGVIDLGAVVAYFGMLRLLEFPTFTSTWAYTQVSLGMSSARRILELITSETNLDQNALGRDAVMQGGVEFRDVTFAYPGGDSILQNISFTIKPGQTVAIVGQTGAGKTSLVKLINRTYDVSGGKILIDGVDVRDWNLASLRSQISMIEQDIFLFSRTISENIAFGKPDSNQEQIEMAAHGAQAHEFVTTFDQSYATVVGERGVTLSGGQRQRLALARAFLTDPRILILDDSTSAIDSATEDKIQRAISTAAKGRTTFIITHRLSQIRWADLIIVLRKGRIAAIGSHADLMQTSEAYSRIFRE
jgi:ATP-binding cassette subfamily B protein